MKVLKYIYAFFVAAVLVGCNKEDNVFGEQNRGKQRPVVKVTLDEIKTVVQNGMTTLNVSFSINVSDGIGQYAYAVLTGDAETPDAYSVLVGEVENTLRAGTYNHIEGKNVVSYSFSASISEGEGEKFPDYIVYAAAITPSGLTSDVASAVIKASDIPEPELDPE